MKKLISILILSAALLSTGTRVFAQAPDLQAVRAGDTLVNTDTLVKEFYFTDGYAGIILTPVVTKLSGTVAGTAYFYISPNGVDYPATPADSLVLANVSTRQFPATGFRLTAPVAYRCKVVFITSGTQSYKTAFYVLTRRYAGNTGGNFGMISPWSDGEGSLSERLDTELSFPIITETGPAITTTLAIYRAPFFISNRSPAIKRE